jgi:hypothetical protein
MTKRKQDSVENQDVKPVKKNRRGRSAIRKGKQFERDLANELGHIFHEAKRHLEYQADEAAQGTDLDGTDIFQFQAKNHQNYVSISTIFDVKLKSNEHIPVLVTKGNKLPTMAVIPWEEFKTLLAIAYGLRKPFVSGEQREQSKFASTVKSLPPFNPGMPLMVADVGERQQVLEHTLDHIAVGTLDDLI